MLKSTLLFVSILIFATGCSQFGTTNQAGPAILNVITCEVPENCMVRLTWSDQSNNETGFEVERAVGGTSQPFAPLGSAGMDASGYEDKAVAVGTVYCYRVRAINETAVSEYSGVACGAVTGTGPVQLTFSQ